MGMARFVVMVACLGLCVGCGGPGEAAPTDASIDDFCAAREWFTTEGMERLSKDEFPPPDDALAALAQDWAKEFTRVGTPENMSPDARAGFEKAVDRLDDLEGGEVDDMVWDWQGEDHQSKEAEVFRNYMSNTCS